MMIDIKLGQFTKEELDLVRRKIKNRQAAGFDEIPLEVWKTRKFDDILVEYCDAEHKLNTIDKGMHPPFSLFPYSSE